MKGDPKVIAVLSDVLKAELTAINHIDWMEGQLHAIGEMGLQNYLSQQLHDTKE